MRTTKLATIILATASILSGCDSSIQPYDDNYSVTEQPIINGTKITDDEYISVVGLLNTYMGMDSIFCSGTLITPTWVLTAAHCFEDFKLNDKSIGIGNSATSFKKKYKIDQIIIHPDYFEDRNTATFSGHDIALIHLTESVPPSLAIPIPPMPKKLDMTISEVDSTPSIVVTGVGFGMIDAADNSSAGTKYKTDFTIYAYCPLEGEQSKHCDENYYIWTYSHAGRSIIDDDQSHICLGDSGGPILWTRNGEMYVVGVASLNYSQDCDGKTAETIISEYEDFILQYVDDLASDEPEDCTNEIDDNDDGRIDCADPRCFNHKTCLPEVCNNGEDDNENGLVDCEEDSCSDSIYCQPEDCFNFIDDNANGLIDCLDPDCASVPQCQPEICDNGKDDNGDGKIDCDDPECFKELKCQPEVCNNGKDDNGDGKIDCDDPECASKAICQPEICDNGKDDNDNGLSDCLDPACFSVPACIPENCNNKIDDNSDGKIDCDDPQCSAATVCQKEICDDALDNNGDGKIDCDDDDCADACSIEDSSSGSSCSINAQNSTHIWPIFMLLAAVAGLFRRRYNA